MNEIIIYTLLILLGLCLGSFAGATVWRLRARQLIEDKASGERVDKKEFKRLEKLTGKNTSSDRSQCLACGHRLSWYDLVPLVSWLGLKGRCRYCNGRIGGFEPAIEIATAVFFIVSYMFWPVELLGLVEVVQFIVWLVVGVGLIILFAYDMKWFLLPNSIVFTLIGLGSINALIDITQSTDSGAKVLSIAGALAVLSGLYYILYRMSQGAWIGFGDIKLGIVLALMLADWQLAVLALFAANVIGLLFVLPMMVSGKVTRKSRVPFGPMLILGFWLAGLGGYQLLDMYYLSLIFY